jgi:hypothetical protein
MFISEVRYVEDEIYNAIVGPGLKVLFSAPGDADLQFAALQRLRPLFAPAMIDMAHLGAMLGGSFLPGIEVGREAGISRNWSLFHGATKYFPSIRFMRADSPVDHTLGTLTKDLAVPWTDDFKRCDEAWWPTSRPGRTTTDPVSLTRHNWQIRLANSIPHLGAAAADDIQFVKEYWKALGFIRRNADDEFIEEEQTWH